MEFATGFEFFVSWSESRLTFKRTGCIGFSAWIGPIYLKIRIL